MSEPLSFISQLSSLYILQIFLNEYANLTSLLYCTVDSSLSFAPAAS